MKRKLISVFLMLVFVLSAIPVYAAEEAGYAGRVLDEADILSDSQEKALAEKVDELVETYELDVAILTFEDFKQYSSTQNAHTFAEEFYKQAGYGFDDKKSGILFLVSMEERDWAMYIQGDARVAVNNYGYDYLTGRLLDLLGDDEYYQAFDQYLDDLGNFFAEYEEGTPYGDDHPVRSLEDVLLWAGVTIAVSAVLAFLVVSSMKRSMNTARPQVEAREYMKRGSFVLTTQQDVYLYSKTTKTAIPKQSSSGSGGGGRSSGSKGGSGGSGKF